MKFALISLAILAVIGCVLVLFVVLKFGSVAAKAHGEALHKSVGAWMRIAEFAQAQGKRHYIDEADRTLEMLRHDLKAWREMAPSGIDFTVLEKMQRDAYEQTDRNIRSGQNPLAYLDEPIEDIIHQNADKPAAESILPIADSLAEHRIFLSTDEATTKPSHAGATATQPTTMSVREVIDAYATKGVDVQFKSGTDSDGALWAHVYTSPETLPPGPSIELSFRHFFSMIETDPRWAGIVLNPGSDASYRVRRDLFATVKEMLQARADR